MKALNQSACLLTLSLFFSAGQARAEDIGSNVQLTDCVIYVHSDSGVCTGAAALDATLAAREKPKTWFRDHDWAANAVAGRCAERAQEFLNWCGGSYAFSVYRVQGHNVLGAAANTSGRVQLSDGGSRWINFHN